MTCSSMGDILTTEINETLKIKSNKKYINKFKVEDIEDGMWFIGSRHPDSEKTIFFKISGCLSTPSLSILQSSTEYKNRYKRDMYIYNYSPLSEIEIVIKG